MHPLEGQMYDLMTTLVEKIWESQIATVLIPSLTLFFLIRFLKWSHTTSRGEREEEMRDEWNESTGIAVARTRRAMGQDVADPEGNRRYRRSSPGRRRW